VKIKDCENGLKKKKERQRKQKIEKMVFRKRKNDIGNRIQGELTKERAWRNDSGIQRQRKWTEERDRTTAKREDRENGFK